jgi:hypothetical protein
MSDMPEYFSLVLHPDPRTLKTEKSGAADINFNMGTC